MIYNPNESALLARLEAVEEYIRSNPLQSASIGRGGIRVYDGGVILIENGGLRVVGWADILGALNGEGNLNWSGSAFFDGPVEITDTLKVLAATTLEAVTRVLGDLRVEADGTITAGNVKITPDKIEVGGGSSPATLQDGKMSFATGGAVEADTDVGGAKLTAGDAVANVGSVASIRKGSSSVIVAPGSVTVNAAGGGPITLQGQVTIPLGNLPTVVDPDVEQGTLRVLGSGTLVRTVLF